MLDDIGLLNVGGKRRNSLPQFYNNRYNDHIDYNYHTVYNDLIDYIDYNDHIDYIDHIDYDNSTDYNDNHKYHNDYSYYSYNNEDVNYSKDHYGYNYRDFYGQSRTSARCKCSQRWKFSNQIFVSQ